MGRRIGVTNPEGQHGTVDPDVGVSSFVPDTLANQAAGVAGSFVNARLFGIPGFMTGQARRVRDFTEQHAEEFNRLGMLGRTARGTYGLLGKAGDVAAPFFARQPSTGGEQAAQLAAGLAGGLTGLPGKAAGRALRPVTETAHGAKFFLSGKQQIATAEQGRGALAGVMREAGDVLETRLGGLKGTFEVTDEVGRLQQAMQADPNLAALVQQGIEKAARVGDTTLMDLLTSPSPSKIVSALQGQQMLATLRMAKPVGQALGRAGSSMLHKGGAFLRQTSDEALELLTHVKDIQAKAVQAFPKAFPDIIGEFAVKAKGFRELVPKFKKGALVGNIKQGFGDPEVAKTVQQTLPADVVRELFLPTQARQVGQALKWTGIAGVAGEGIRRLWPQ